MYLILLSKFNFLRNCIRSGDDLSNKIATFIFHHDYKTLQHKTPFHCLSEKLSSLMWVRKQSFFQY
jgi:hypothetical protein